jgi:hypothetical protein
VLTNVKIENKQRVISLFTFKCDLSVIPEEIDVAMSGCFRYFSIKLQVL